MSSYSIEHSKSARAKCKKCKEPIAKAVLRIGAHSEDGGSGYSTTSWYHPKCFSLPRKLKSAGVTAESFVEDTLRDDTADDDGSNAVLQDPVKVQEIIADIEYTKPRASAKKKKRGEEGYEPPADGTVAKLKEMRESLLEEEPAAKKPKLSEEDMAKVDIYVMHEKATNNDLHDILKWNRQLVSGNKDLLMARVIDGQMHGRLGRCPMCLRGKLQLEDSTAKKAVCKGFFNDEIQARESCSFNCPIDQAAREHPWFTEKPSEEEEAALDAASEALKSGSKVGGDDDGLVTNLEEKAEALDWNVDNKAGLQKAAMDIMNVCDEAGVDLGENAKMEVGKIITSNRTLPPSEIAKLVVEKYGFAEQNEAAAEKKQAAVSAVCHKEANAEIVALMLELSKLYFKDHNPNTGITYKNVAQAVSELDFEITKDNAKGLGKGKTKVPGIGKSSAEKIHEFLTTGTIAKLEEKRQTVDA